MKFVSLDEAVSAGYLENWYIDSVASDRDPVWTEKHIEELTEDFIVIPKEALKKGVVLEIGVDLAKEEPKKPVNEPKVTMCRAWGMQMEIAKEVAREAIEALGLEDRDLVQINVRADMIVGGVVAEITERVDDTVRNYSYVSKKVGWNFK